MLRDLVVYCDKWQFPYRKQKALVQEIGRTKWTRKNSPATVCRQTNYVARPSRRTDTNWRHQPRVFSSGLSRHYHNYLRGSNVRSTGLTPSCVCAHTGPARNSISFPFNVVNGASPRSALRKTNILFLWLIIKSWLVCSYIFTLRERTNMRCLDFVNKKLVLAK